MGKCPWVIAAWGNAFEIKVSKDDYFLKIDENSNFTHCSVHCEQLSKMLGQYLY